MLPRAPFRISRVGISCFRPSRHIAKSRDRMNFSPSEASELSSSLWTQILRFIHVVLVLSLRQLHSAPLRSAWSDNIANVEAPNKHLGNAVNEYVPSLVWRSLRSSAHLVRPPLCRASGEPVSEISKPRRSSCSLVFRLTQPL